MPQVQVLSSRPYRVFIRDLAYEHSFILVITYRAGFVPALFYFDLGYVKHSIEISVHSLFSFTDAVLLYPFIKGTCAVAAVFHGLITLNSYNVFNKNQGDLC